jgi:hypothetical protein
LSREKPTRSQPRLESSNSTTNRTQNDTIQPIEDGFLLQANTVCDLTPTASIEDVNLGQTIQNKPKSSQKTTHFYQTYLKFLILKDSNVAFGIEKSENQTLVDSNRSSVASQTEKLTRSRGVNTSPVRIVDRSAFFSPKKIANPAEDDEWESHVIKVVQQPPPPPPKPPQTTRIHVRVRHGFLEKTVNGVAMLIKIHTRPSVTLRSRSHKKHQKSRFKSAFDGYKKSLSEIKECGDHRSQTNVNSEKTGLVSEVCESEQDEPASDFSNSSLLGGFLVKNLLGPRPDSVDTSTFSPTSSINEDFEAHQSKLESLKSQDLNQTSEEERHLRVLHRVASVGSLLTHVESDILDSARAGEQSKRVDDLRELYEIGEFDCVACVEASVRDNLLSVRAFDQAIGEVKFEQKDDEPPARRVLYVGDLEDTVGADLATEDSHFQGRKK